MTNTHITKIKPQNPDKLCGLDLFSTIGKGMLATEALRNAPGLTPLRFNGEIQNNNLKIGSLVEEFSATEGTEKRRRLSGISAPLSLCGNIRKGGEK